MIEVEHSYRKIAIWKQFDALQFSTVARVGGKGRAQGAGGRRRGRSREGVTGGRGLRTVWLEMMCGVEYAERTGSADILVR
jgi:hypothetical protein